jgi:hypothetical protein
MNNADNMLPQPQDKKHSAMLRMFLDFGLTLDAVTVLHYLLVQMNVLHFDFQSGTERVSVLYWIFPTIEFIFLLAIRKRKRWGAYGLGVFSVIRFAVNIMLDIKFFPTALLRLTFVAAVLLLLRPVWRSLN